MTGTHAGSERDAAGTRLRDLVIVSGFSGAGKSIAMNVFEDAGYFCVDNLPAEMIGSLADLFRHHGSHVERACVVSDPRGGDLFHPLLQVIDQLEAAGLPHRLVFLHADEGTLVTRYKETRRRHPLAASGSVGDGIAAERRLLAPIRERADVVVDTTGLSPSELRRRVARELLGGPRSAGTLSVTVTSFGFKHGPPRDADVAVDVRFLANPHYVADLRPLTGLDERVVRHIAEDGRLQEFYDRFLGLLDFLLPQYVAEGKSHLVVAIGCTGGRHRSVAIAERIAAHVRARADCTVEVAHRDVER